MQITGIANLKELISGAVLRATNEQPQLAGDLISKTVAGLMQQSQTVQSPGQPVPVSGMPETGSIINTTA